MHQSSFLKFISGITDKYVKSRSTLLLPSFRKVSHCSYSLRPQRTPFCDFSSASSCSYRDIVANGICRFFSGTTYSRKVILNTCGRNLTDCWTTFFRIQPSRRSHKIYLPFYSSRFRWRLWLSRLNSDGVVLGLIVTNAAILVLWRVAEYDFMLKNFTLSLNNVLDGRLHTLITSAFSHIEVGHIISNMIGLYFFGTNIGRTLGPKFLLKLYFAGALGGSVLYLAHQSFMSSKSKVRSLFSMHPSGKPQLGASGAVSSIMLLNIFLYPKSTLYLQFIVPVPAILLGIFLIGNDILRIIEGDSHISGAGHLGGAAVAVITWAGIRRGRL